MPLWQVQKLKRAYFNSFLGGSRGEDAGYCLITTEAPEGAIREIHARMPLQFTHTEDMMLWLEESHHSWTQAHGKLLERTFTGRGKEGLATMLCRAPELEYFRMDPVIAEKEQQVRRDNFIDVEAINHENNLTAVATRPSEDLKDFFRIRKLPRREKNEGL